MSFGTLLQSLDETLSLNILILALFGGPFIDMTSQIHIL